MKQLTIYDILEALGELTDQPETHEQDETPTKCDQIDEPASEPSMSIIEAIIFRFLEKCLEEDKLPTYEQAKIIETLDAILSKYND